MNEIKIKLAESASKTFFLIKQENYRYHFKGQDIDLRKLNAQQLEKLEKAGFSFIESEDKKKNDEPAASKK